MKNLKEDLELTISKEKNQTEKNNYFGDST